jgi:DNA-binding MarR family transcriptional regulator
MTMHRARAERDSFVVVDALRRLVRELRESARVAQGRAQITGAQLYVLRVLVAEPGLSINELAERTMTHQSSVSVVVSRLVAAGLVTRAQARDDRRRMVVTPTARGRAVHKRSPAVAQEKLITAVRLMAPAERRAVARGLGSLVQALGASRGKPAMFFEEEDGVADEAAPPRVARPAKLEGKSRPYAQ